MTRSMNPPGNGRQTYDRLNEAIDHPSDGLQLAQENSILRGIIAELLIKNQNLRWTLRGQQGAS